jgi:alpha-tubulin suppressor-like RCC1 family protein
VTTGDIANVAVGGNTSCAVTIGGEVFCWGDGAYGALSDGTVGDQSPSPVAAMGFAAGAVTLALGDHHGCALLTGQTVQCWGDDEQGQLGDGQRQPRATPVTPISLPPEVTGVATGGSHTCVTTASGSVWCWGDNTSGQLGTSANSSEVQPTEVPGLTTAATAVAAGEAFTCALVAGGRVQCWGDGSNGQIGMMGGSSTPVTVSLPAPVTAIAAGAQHACAITMSGTVMCWGADTANQLGSPGSSSQTTPVVVPGVSGVVAISAGGNETCIIDSSGAVDCWGSDPVGDMGAGPAGPGVVPSLTSGVAKVSAVGGHACAVTKGGAPKCWGTNDAGNLGDGSMLQSWAPIDVPAI